MNNNIESENKEEIKKLNVCLCKHMDDVKEPTDWNKEYIITADTNIDELRKLVNNQQNIINDLMKIVEDFEDRISTITIEASI